MNLLTNVLPTKVRQGIYAALVVAAAIYGAYQASDGDWRTFVGAALTALIGLMAASNARPAYEPPNVVDPPEHGAFSVVGLLACVVVFGLFLALIDLLGWI